MDEYHSLASRTRDLEQKYISLIFKEHSKQLGDLEAELERRQEEPAADPQSSEVISELRGQIARLTKEKNSLEASLLDEQEKAADLQKMLETEQPGALSRKDTTKENAELKSMLEKARSSGQTDSAVLAQLEKTQKEMLALVKNFASISEDCRARVTRLEKTAGNEPQPLSQYKRIAELEREIECLRSKNYELERSQRQADGKKDTIVLLEDAVAKKEKIIERQEEVIRQLRAQTANPFGTDTIQPVNPFGGGKVVVDGPARAMAADVPVKRIAANEPVLKKKTNEATALKKKAVPKKMVSVENLIRDGNKSFFNNLSFTNSSPAVDKRAKKKD